jgi:hypothetical protein
MNTPKPLNDTHYMGELYVRKLYLNKVIFLKNWNIVPSPPTAVQALQRQEPFSFGNWSG